MSIPSSTDRPVSQSICWSIDWSNDWSSAICWTVSAVHLSISAEHWGRVSRSFS